MTQKLKPSDIQEINKFKTAHPIGRVLYSLKDWSKFTVGDVLIRHRIMPSGTSDIDIVGTTCPVPKKFRVVYIDDLGVPWIKQMSVRGGLGIKLWNLVDASHHGSYVYSVDPEQLDAILLGYKYDPRIEYRRLRDQNPEYGKNIKDDE